MNALSEIGRASIGGANQAGQQQLEIEREVNSLHDKLSELDSALANLGAKLTTVMRANNPCDSETAPANLSPLNSLGTQIRSAAGRVGVHIDIVRDILNRLEIQ